MVPYERQIMKAQQSQVFAGETGRYVLCCTEQGRWYLSTVGNYKEERILLEQHGPEDGLPWFPSVKYICAIASIRLGCRVRPVVDFEETAAVPPEHREIPLSEREWTEGPKPAHQQTFSKRNGWYDRHYPSGPTA
jgi:hypothetical protein